MKKAKIRGKIFVISSPSGGGKTTLGQRLLERTPHLVRSISMTTRHPRPGEIDGIDYYFVSEADFRKTGRASGFLEHARVFNCSYGTPRKFVERAMREGDDVLLLIDVQGAAQVKKRMKEAVLIFVMPPSIAELKERLEKRASDSAGDIRKRLKIAQHEMNRRDQYDYVVENRYLEKALSHVEAIILAERLKVKK